VQTAMVTAMPTLARNTLTYGGMIVIMVIILLR
jgi:hypothetical protein